VDEVGLLGNVDSADRGVATGRLEKRSQVGFRSVARMRMVVVLPAPLGPTNPKISPSGTSKVT